MCTIDTQKLTNVEILMKIKEEIDEIDKTVVEKCNAVSKALQPAFSDREMSRIRKGKMLSKDSMSTKSSLEPTY